jgi:hypothetical protein
MKRLAKNRERERIVLSDMPELSVPLVEYARQHGPVTIGEMVALTGTSRNTLKRHFRQLQEKDTSFCVEAATGPICIILGRKDESGIRRPVVECRILGGEALLLRCNNAVLGFMLSHLQ